MHERREVLVQGGAKRVAGLLQGVELRLDASDAVLDDWPQLFTSGGVGEVVGLQVALLERDQPHHLLGHADAPTLRHRNLGESFLDACQEL